MQPVRAASSGRIKDASEAAYMSVVRLGADQPVSDTVNSNGSWALRVHLHVYFNAH